MRGGEVKRHAEMGQSARSPIKSVPPLYLCVVAPAGRLTVKPARSVMVETRIKPYNEQVAEQARRAEQQRAYRRNQVLGLILVAAVILVWALLHTHPSWIFPPGWWRL